MRVAVIGLGSAGRRHIGNLLALGCDVFCDDYAEAAVLAAVRDYPGVKEWDCDEASIDAAVIATPYDTHLTWVEAFVRSGTPMFIEKPLGSLEQLPRWREIAAMALPVNQVGYQCRFHPKAQAMKLLFPAPAYGMLCCRCQLDPKYGPFLLEAVSHDVDLALWLGARPDRLLLKRLGDGRPPFSEWTVWYEESADYYRSWQVETEDDNSGVEVYFESPEELGDQMYRDELAHFLDCVRDGTPTLCPLADGLRVLEVCDKVMREVPA